MTAKTSEEELERELRAHLEPGEELLWSGRPQTGILFRSCEPLVIFLSAWGGLPWLAAIFLFVNLFRDVEWIAFFLEPALLVGMFYILVGWPYLSVGRFFYDARKRGRTLYAVTDRRLIILSGLLWRFCRSRTYDRVRWIAKERSLSGRTSIWFGPRPLLYAFQGDYPVDQAPELSLFRAAYVYQIQHMRPAGLVSVRFGWFLFELIEDGEVVYALAEEARRKARS